MKYEIRSLDYSGMSVLSIGLGIRECSISNCVTAFAGLWDLTEVYVACAAYRNFAIQLLTSSVKLTRFQTPDAAVQLFILYDINPLKPELNPICYLLALLGAHHFLHVSRIRVKLLTLR